MLDNFNMPWHMVPVVVIDTETTGVKPGVDKACSVALVRFERGKRVDSLFSLIDPQRDIPIEAQQIHGISNQEASGCPTIDQFFDSRRAKELLAGAQPAAYNAPFDREFVTREAFEDWSWPWLDPLVFVRDVDRRVKGKGRHTLSVACERHGVELRAAHSALADASAAGELLTKIVPKALERERMTTPDLGQLLLLQGRMAAVQWFEFAAWLSRKNEDAV